MNIDDKILGEKRHYYCSSDEDDDDDDCDVNNETEAKLSTVSDERTDHFQVQEWDGSSVNTGPKGVIKDWQRYKQLEVERRESQEKEKIALMKKLSMECRTVLDEESEQNIDDDIEKLLNGNDPYIREYMQRRMQEMMEKVHIERTQRPTFGKLIHLNSGPEFLVAIDKENNGVTVICHIYSYDTAGCDAMNDSLQSLATQYPSVKFCTLEAASAGMSKHFEKSGVPALLVYKSGNLLGNFVRLTDEFGDKICSSDVENFLIEHGFLPDQSLVPKIIKGSIMESAADESDSE